jgi:hypothetical protein
MNIDTEQYQQLLQWFELGLGQDYLQSEQSLYAKYFKTQHGNNILLPTAFFQKLAGLESFKNQTKFELSDFSKKLVYPDAAFDCIVLPHILEFCSEPKLIFFEAQRLLNPEGTLLISGFCDQWYQRLVFFGGTNLDKKIAKMASIPRGDLKALGLLMGLDCCSISYFRNPRLPLIRAGYLLALRRSEYGVTPLSIKTFAQPVNIIQTPSLASVSLEKS